MVPKRDEKMIGLTTVNIELTNACNKKCFMCGRRKAERDFPELYAKYNQSIDFGLLENIYSQLPEGIVVQFHNNGEPLLYPKLGEALRLFATSIRCFNTNGKLLVHKADEIIDNMETLTVSIIENDPEGEEQYESIKAFLKLKQSRPPYMVYRLLGNIDARKYSELGGLICTRILHSPMGSFNYSRVVTKPEIGICLDLLNHCAIDVNGNVSICVRFDPEGHGILGNIKDSPLYVLWNSTKRLNLIQEHIKGNRGANKLCEKCHFYGVPTGW